MAGTLLAEATLTGAVTGTTTSLATLTGQVATSPATPASFTGTTTTVLVDSYDSTAVLYGVQVLLEGVDVTGDLVGPVTITDSIDNPFARASFTIEGESYSPLVTETTWTRVGDVTIKFLQGVAGSVQTQTVLVGVIETCAPAGRTTYSINVVDLSHKYANTPVCYELAPLAGLTRGQIAAALAAAAGLSTTSIPPGEVYTKAVSAGSRKLFDILPGLGSPEGWSWRTKNDGTLEAYVPALKVPPEAPDHVWDVGDLLARPGIDPPNNVPDRWVVRGMSAVSEDEVGQVTETETYEVYTTRALRVAVQEQDTSGVITSTGFSSSDATRLTSRIITKTTKLKNQIIRRETEEWGLYNPRVGKWHTSSGGSVGAGPQADGYYYLAAYIDEDGEYVKWRQERLVRVGRRVEQYTYTSDNLTQLTVDTYGWYSIERAVRDGGSVTPNVGNTAIGADDVSYKPLSGNDEIEAFGLKASQIVSYTYDSTTGAVNREQTSTSRYGRIRSRIDSSSYYVNADGVGQNTEIDVSWRLYERIIKWTILDDNGRLAGETIEEWDYGVTELPEGVGLYDWGDFSSNLQTEKFKIRRKTSKQIDILSEDSYTEIEYDEGGDRKETLRLGSPPLPRYETSAYTRLVQEPIEVEWESDVLTTWFGPETHVITNEWIQTEAEARSLLERLRSRALSWQVRVQRPDHYAIPGDTVLLTDREQGLAHRALVVERNRVRDLSVPTATATYTLEIPFLPWGPS